MGAIHEEFAVVDDVFDWAVLFTENSALKGNLFHSLLLVDDDDELLALSTGFTASLKNAVALNNYPVLLLDESSNFNLDLNAYGLTNIVIFSVNTMADDSRLEGFKCLHFKVACKYDLDVALNNFHCFSSKVKRVLPLFTVTERNDECTVCAHRQEVIDQTPIWLCNYVGCVICASLALAYGAFMLRGGGGNFEPPLVACGEYCWEISLPLLSCVREHCPFLLQLDDNSIAHNIHVVNNFVKYIF